MAYIVSSEQYFLNGASTNLALALPPHATDDVIIMHCAMDTGTTVTGTGTTGTWTSIGNTTATNNTGSCFYRKMTSGSETVSVTTTDAYTIWFVVCRDVDTTTTLDVTSSFTNVNTATSTPVSTSITTTTADALILYFVGIDGVATQTHSDPGVMSLGSFDSTGTTATTSAAQGAAWYIQRTAGAVPAPTWTASASGTYTKYTIALRNKSGGIVPPYIDDSAAPAVILTSGHHTGTLNNISFPGTLTSTAAINGKTATYSAATAGADFGINPYSSALAKTSATVAVTVLAGYEIIFTGNRNVSTGLIVGSFIAATPKTGTFSVGSISQGGLVVRIGSSSTAWCAYQVGARDSVPTTEQRYVFAIQPGYTASAYGTPGTAVTTTALSYMQFMLNCPKQAAQVYMSELFNTKVQILAGGTSTAPVDSDGVSDIGRSFRLPVIQKSGASGLLSYVPIQVGGGDAINFQINAGSLQFPRNYSVVTKEVNFHAAADSVGISYAGKSGDVIKHTNSVITSASSFYWEINSAATSAATWDFTGTVITNATVRLRPVMTFDSMTFTGCTGITTNASVVSNSIFSVNPEIVAAGGAFSSCVFTAGTAAAGGTVSITGASQAALQTALNLFTSCTFSNNTVPLGALRIIYTGAAGAVALTMTGNTFTGNTTDIRWEAPSGSNLTISKISGANPSTYTATNSNTVTFSASYPITVTVKDTLGNLIVGNGSSTGARVSIYKSENVKISSASWAASVITINTAVAHGLVVGNSVVVTAASPAGYNGIYTVVTQPSSTQITVANAVNPGTYVTGGTTTLVVVAPTYTNASGQVTGAFGSAIAIRLKVRLATTAGSKYIPQDISGDITTGGYTTTVTMIKDTMLT